MDCMFVQDRKVKDHLNFMLDLETIQQSLKELWGEGFGGKLLKKWAMMLILFGLNSKFQISLKFNQIIFQSLN